MNRRISNGTTSCFLVVLLRLVQLRLPCRENNYAVVIYWNPKPLSANTFQLPLFTLGDRLCSQSQTRIFVPDSDCAEAAIVADQELELFRGQCLPGATGDAT